MKFEHYGIGIAKGLRVTLRHLFRRPVTVQYPEQRLIVSRRTRGNELIWDDIKCTGCATCAKSCPIGAICIVTSVNAEGDKYIVEKIEVDTGYCIQCGLCVEACPFGALYMGYAYERAKYRREDVVQANETLLASAQRRPSGLMDAEIPKELHSHSILLERIEEE